MANSKKRRQGIVWMCLVDADIPLPGPTRQPQPDIVVVDASASKANAVQATARLKREYPAAKIVVVTPREDGGYVRSLLAAGASGHVPHRAAVNDLLRAIGTASHGALTADATTAGPLVRPGARHTKKARSGELTAREAEVLRLIAWGQSNKEIADRLNVSVKTVEYHKARSTAKLGLRSRADILRYALSQRWLQNGEDSR